MTDTNKKRGGFSAMDPERHREIARLGGITAHRKGVAHEFTSEEARNAGRKKGKGKGRKARQLSLPFGVE